MKKIYILFIVLLGLNLNAQIVNIPDANFKAMLLSASSSNFIASNEIPVYEPLDDSWSVSTYSPIDINGDGEIQVNEAQSIKWLNIPGANISDLSGIESFVNLQYLDVSYINSINNNNQLTSLDISNLVNLQYINCAANQLVSLDISNLNNLQFVNCSNNQLVSLDVSNLTNLNSLFCNSNSLISLNISSLSNLSLLNCQNNQLVNLDISNLTNLKTLRCGENELSSLDVSNLTSLEYLHCFGNQMTNLNLSGNSNLGYIFCYGNQLTNLNLSGCINLVRLDCYNNQLTSLDVSECIVLNDLKCYNNQLTNLLIKNGNPSPFSLIFSNNPNLQYICADDEDLILVNQKINQLGYTNCHVNSYCSFIPNGTFYSIQGNTKFDNNFNGCDILDVDYKNLYFNHSINGNLVGVYISNSTGFYSIPVQAGSHTITPRLENPTSFNISPTSFTVDFPTQASPFTQDFCVTLNSVYSDVEVVILPITPARPGFDAHYKIIYKNKGNQIENGAITLTYNDAVLDYVSANPVYDSQATDAFTWNYANLESFETRVIEVVFNVNSPTETPAVNINDVLNYNAVISTLNTDETPSDNEFTLNQTVVGSYDPNDKTCLEGEIVGPDMIGEYVHYLIRFENTGTYPAENVVVKDMIDMAKFDITTLIPLRGSHDFYTRIKDNKVEFIFENINLDFNDATNDGFVAFKIKTKPTLALGDTFSNNANIYFDYNFPITTNTYTTTFQALSTQDFDFSSKFTLYPNPVQDVLHFNSKESLEIQSVEIYNMLGQIVISVPNSTTSIDVSSLKSGNYFLKVNTEQGISNTKFIKE